MSVELNNRIETEFEVQQYLSDLKYAIDHNASLIIQETRNVDINRDQRFTNRFTLNDLFPDEDPKIALKRELLTLTVENYIETVKDLRFPKKSEMRVFSKKYNLKDDVYIKIRVELLGDYGNGFTYVMSFHYAEECITENMFPYRRK